MANPSMVRNRAWMDPQNQVLKWNSSLRVVMHLPRLGPVQCHPRGRRSHLSVDSASGQSWPGLRAGPNAD